MSGHHCHPHPITYLLFALRLCGYNPNYLKNPAAASKVWSSLVSVMFNSPSLSPPSSLSSSFPHFSLPSSPCSTGLTEAAALDCPGRGWLAVRHRPGPVCGGSAEQGAPWSSHGKGSGPPQPWGVLTCTYCLYKVCHWALQRSYSSGRMRGGGLYERGCGEEGSTL